MSVSLQPAKMRRLNFLFLIIVIGASTVFLYSGNDRLKRYFSAVGRMIEYEEENIFRDLTEEFEQSTGSDSKSFNVLEAIEDAGYTVTPLSCDTTKKTSDVSSEDTTSATGDNSHNRLNSSRVPIILTSLIKISTKPHKLSSAAAGKLQKTTTISPSTTTTTTTTTKKVQQPLAPNVVHYVFIGSDLHFTFVNYLSYRSVERFIKPDQIFIHGDHVPDGPWWNRTVNEVKNIYHVNRTLTKNAPNGIQYKFPAHASDYLRADTLLRFGGIYLDADVLVVKSFTPLRRHSFVMGSETDRGLCNGIMVAKKGAPFLKLMLEQYRSYVGQGESWAGKSVYNPYTLAVVYPHLIHIEATSLNRPNWKEKELIYGGLYNWRQNYAVHLWIRLWPAHLRPNGMADILNVKTTFGEISRLVVFGSPEILNRTVSPK